MYLAVSVDGFELRASSSPLIPYKQTPLALAAGFSNVSKCDVLRPL